jgi:hypothetical protein
MRRTPGMASCGVHRRPGGDGGRLARVRDRVSPGARGAGQAAVFSRAGASPGGDVRATLSAISASSRERSHARRRARCPLGLTPRWTASRQARCRRSARLASSWPAAPASRASTISSVSPAVARRRRTPVVLPGGRPAQRFDRRYRATESPGGAGVRSRARGRRPGGVAGDRGQSWIARSGWCCGWSVPGWSACAQTASA